MKTDNHAQSQYRAHSRRLNAAPLRSLLAVEASRPFFAEITSIESELQQLEVRATSTHSSDAARAHRHPLFAGHSHGCTWRGGGKGSVVGWRCALRFCFMIRTNN